MPDPRVSLCLIARDEARLLPDCLASAAPFVDEIVLADTGSTDGTRRIAGDAGAIVVHHPWTDDFAAARNTALAACTGDWILSLDADERLAPGAGERIREAVGCDDIDAFLLTLHNAGRLDAPPAEVVAGPARLGEPFRVLRLLRNVDGLRWERPIHETVEGWLLRRGARAAALDAHLVHVGYLPEVWASAGKEGRNLRILERYCPTAPKDFVAWA